MTDNDNWTASLIHCLRGPPPKTCDFCEQPFTAARYPIPEEAGEWACNDCYKRWGYHK